MIKSNPPYYVQFIRTPVNGFLVYFTGDISFERENTEKKLSAEDMGINIAFEDSFRLNKGDYIVIIFGDYIYKHRNTGYIAESIVVQKSETFDFRFTKHKDLEKDGHW